jgi:hypothetical protein
MKQHITAGRSQQSSRSCRNHPPAAAETGTKAGSAAESASVTQAIGTEVIETRTGTGHVTAIAETESGDGSAAEAEAETDAGGECRARTLLVDMLAAWMLLGHVHS